MRFLFVITLVAAGLILVVYISIQRSVAPRIVSSSAVDPRSVGLVLGASIWSGAPSRALKERLDTAALLYTEGKVKKLILSGDNRAVDYNEPEAMKRYLIEKGIPERDLVLDYAGRRTYDSCYRAKDIFHVQALIVITQDFHLPRALYLCNALGVDALGVAADTTYPVQWFNSYLREIPATIQAWIDINITKPTPVLGNPEKVF